MKHIRINKANYLNKLPDRLPSNIALSRNKKNVRKTNFKYCGFIVDIYNGVMYPSSSTKVILDGIINNKIKVKGKTFLCMGTGSGIELLIAKKKGAKKIIGIDIYKEAVRNSLDNYLRYYPHIEIYVIESNLFNKLDKKIKSDVIVFNPPSIDLKSKTSDSRRRNIFSGSIIIKKFLYQVKRWGLLSKNGFIYVPLSNTSNLKEIIKYALNLNFKIKADITYEEKNLKAFLFTLS